MVNFKNLSWVWWFTPVIPALRRQEGLQGKTLPQNQTNKNKIKQNNVIWIYKV
jgi:hypothetical protein